MTIRKATAIDATEWSELLKEAFGADPVAEQVYDLNRLGNQLFGAQVQETWVAEVDGRLRGSISFLGSGLPNQNPVANLGRYLALPENYRDGSSEALIRSVNEVCVERRQMAVMRVPASDNAQQQLLEKLGYVCVGFQPLKHQCMVREGILFYVRTGALTPVNRLPLSQSLPHVSELARAVLSSMQIPTPEMVRDGLTGYPLQTDMEIEASTPEAFDTCKLQAQAANPPVEVSGYFNRGLGLLRVGAETPLQVLLGQRCLNIVGGLSFYFDEHDRCARVVDAFATDDLSTGALIRRTVQIAQEPYNAVYVEVDFLMTAPRALKSAEQLGFVPVAYLPGFYNRNGRGVDLVKMVKLNAVYSLDNVRLTPQAQRIVDIVDHSFQDQKVGVAIIKLLRELPIFDSLGDGELAKMARLFTQKLYRSGEKVFNKGDSASEAYVVMRGQIDIYLEEGASPVASVCSGATIGEQAFLEGAQRHTIGVAAQPSILLVVQRAAFVALIESEPHLGMVIMRNIAREVSNKLRQTDLALLFEKA